MPDPTRFVAPPAPHHPLCADEIAHYLNLLDQYEQCRRDLYDAERHDLPAAQRADRQAMADAIDAGKPTPAVSRERKAREQVAALKQRLGAIELASTAAYDRLTTALRAASEPWEAQLVEQLAAARDEYAATVEAVASAQANVGQIAGTIAWLRNSQKGTFKPGVPAALRDLVGPNREGLPIGVVLDALRRDAHPDPARGTNADAARVAREQRGDNPVRAAGGGLLGDSAVPTLVIDPSGLGDD